MLDYADKPTERWRLFRPRRLAVAAIILLFVAMTTLVKFWETEQFVDLNSGDYKHSETLFVYTIWSNVTPGSFATKYRQVANPPPAVPRWSLCFWHTRLPTGWGDCVRPGSRCDEIADAISDLDVNTQRPILIRVVDELRRVDMNALDRERKDAEASRDTRRRNATTARSR